jgi:hypothetical protein
MLGCRITCKREQFGLSVCACVGPVLIYDKGEAPAEWVLGDDIGLTTSVLLAAGLLAVSGAESKRNNSKLMECGASDEGITFVRQLRESAPWGLPLAISLPFVAPPASCSFPALACPFSLHGPCPCKNFGTSVSSEEQERSAHLEQITFEKNL